MDPIHLRPSELDYELRIRNIVGLSNIRTGTKTLRDILKREALGIEFRPVDSSPAFTFVGELAECERIIKTINETIDVAEENSGSILWTEAEHRILHLKGRLKRIRVQEIEDSSFLHGLRVDCDNLVRRIANGGRLSVENRISFNIQSERPTMELGAMAQAPCAVPSTSVLPSRTWESLGGQEDFRGFSAGAVDPISRSTGSVSGGRGRGRGKTPAKVLGSGNGTWNSRPSRIPTPPLFTDRLRIPTTPSLFDINRVEAEHGNANEIGEDIMCEDELQNRTRRGNLLNESLSAMNLENTIPTSHLNGQNAQVRSVGANAIPNNYTNTQIRSARANTVSNIRTNAQPTIDRNNSLRHSNSNADADAEERRSVPQSNTRSGTVGPQPRGKNQYRPENFANSKSAPTYVEDRNINNVQQSNLLYETYMLSDRDAEFRNLNNRQVRTSPRSHQTNAQPTAYRQSAPSCSDTVIYADAEEDDRNHGGTATQQPSAPTSAFAHNSNTSNRFNSNRRDDGPPPSAFARNNNASIRVESNQRDNGPPTSAYVNNNPAPNRFEPYSQGPRQSFLQQYDFGQPQVRNAHKSVPVNHWKISFSGDGQGLHLFDFLAQVKMLQRSERIPDHELLPMMVHLFNGRAKNWYGRWSWTMHTWEELEVALKTEFLPENYSFIMLEKITSRKQKTGESIGEFLALMELQFTWLDIPMDDQHKVFIVRNNLLPKYAQSIAAFEIRTLSDLAQVCRRVESATQSVSMNLPFESQNYRSNTAPRPRNMNEVEHEESQVECTGEVCAMGRFGQVKCYNCLKNGHVFRSCLKPRDGVFCYGCGGKNVTTKTCVKCAGNGARGMTNREGQEGSPESPTAAQQNVPPKQSSA